MANLRKVMHEIRHPLGLRHPVPMARLIGGDVYSGKTLGEVGGWGRDPKKCTGSIWGMGSNTI